MNVKSLFLTFVAMIAMVSLQAQPDPATLLKNADAAAKKYKDFTYKFEYKERFRDKGIVVGEMDVKVIETPKKYVWIRAYEPERAQLIWGKTDDKVWVNKGLKLKLAPFNRLLMKNSHHPVYRAGFKRTVDILMVTYNNRKADISSMVKNKGSVTWDGRSCWHLVLTDNKYQIVDYTVKSGENLVTLAEAKAIPEMRIMELNPDINNYFDVEAGDVIKIPTSYGKVTTMYIDKETYLPLYQRVEDDQGLFSEYKHYGMKLNSGLTADDIVWD